MAREAEIQEMPKGALKIEYEPEVDILTIYLQDTETLLGYSSEAQPGVILNYAEDASLSSIEILDASKRYPPRQLVAHSIDEFIESFRTEGRMRKAMQHLRERGLLTESLKDIGPLIVEVKKDIREEETQTIKDFLYKQFIEQIERKAVAGLPEWYKDILLKGAFNEEEKDIQSGTNG